MTPPEVSPAPSDPAEQGPAAGAEAALGRLSLIDDLRRVLKQGDTFAVMDRWGDMEARRSGEHGLFHQGTRFLSRLVLRLDGRRPPLLASAIVRHNTLLAARLTNAPFADSVDGRGTGSRALPREVLHLARHCFLTDGGLHLRLRVQSFALESCAVPLSIHFDADWADVFEVRGMDRAARGETCPPRVDASELELAYVGLDGRNRTTRLTFSPAPERLSGEEAVFRLRLDRGEQIELTLSVACELDGSRRSFPAWSTALDSVGQEMNERRRGFARLHTTNELFNEWASRSTDDFCQLLTDVPGGGIYPHAGIPWYSTPFGRDGIIAALECLWIAPAPARGVLAYLAATQATEEDPARDAQPGKVVHEVRGGEMAALDEVPFSRYYGSVDATPLFLVLAGAYHQRTADLAFLESILPSLELALRWMEEWGDVDGDGLIEYRRRSPEGLVNQGWKDSWDAVFHADGTLPEGAVALVEVQGYAYDARRRMAALFRDLERPDRARELERQAAELRSRFEERFWCDDLGCYALGLDGRKRKLRVRSSNAGHALFSRIASPERAARVVKLLMSKDFFSGWGIRTLAAGEPRYNPMSYHNGSVWPHDNALIALGLTRYGYGAECLALLEGMFDASLFLDQRRMPELFCGFPRGAEEGPSHYPEANVPQAWSAGAVFLLLQAALGLRIEASERRITLVRPSLPAFLPRVQLSDLRVGDGRVDLLFSRHRNNVGVEVLRRDPDIEVRVVS